MRKYFAIFLVALLGGGLGTYIVNYKTPKDISSGSTPPVAFVQLPTRPKIINNQDAVPPDFVTAAQISTPAVVHIQTIIEGSYPNGPVPDYYRDFFWFFNQPQSPKVTTGSGVIISPDGYIVSNNHVVDEATQIQVTLNDKRTFKANVIAKDPNTDLALLKVEGNDLPFIKFGDSEKVLVGEWALAVGNPFNLTSTVTAGIISAKGRNINIFNKGIYPYAIESFIQTDAAINPGNSGGALVNLSGELIGINTAIASQTGSYAGYGFAIPSNLTRKIIDDFLKYGVVQRAFIGISMQSVDADLAREKNLKDIKGVYVANVLEGGAAQSAGVKDGDVIIAINEHPVNSSSEMQELVGQFRPGEKVKLTINRNSKTLNLDVILKNLQGNTETIKKEKAEKFVFMDAEFSTLSEDEKSRIGLKFGIKVENTGNSKFREIGIEPGFVITGIDNRPVYSPDDLKKCLKSRKGGVLIEGYYSRGRKVFYGIELE